MEIAGAVAVVTGASSGIGEAVAVDLASRGASVLVVARREDRLAAVVDRCNATHVDAHSYRADLSTKEACQQVVAAAMTQFGRVDILVNNAGVSVHRNIAETTPDDVEQVMAVNFFAAVHLTLGLLPSMLRQVKGSIINITSVAARVPNAAESAYGASKAALARWSHGLAVDLHGTGVHVGEVAPGPIDTEIWGHVGEVPYRGKLYKPQVVADAVARMIDKGQVFTTVPRRFGAVGVAYPFVGSMMRRSLRRYEDAAQRQSTDADEEG